MREHLPNGSSYRTIVYVCALSVGGCGGGGGGDNSSATSDVTNYWSCGNLPSYAAEFGGNLLRWKKSFPLTVKIDLTNAPRVTEGNNRARYMGLIQAAALAWKVAGDGRIGDLIFVDTENADVTINFGSLPVASEIARTTYKRDGPFPTSYIETGTSVTLSARSFDNFISQPSFNTIFGSPSFEYTLSQTITHEMGHALFAASHSSQGEDVMSAGFRPASKAPKILSTRDINSLREAYCKSLGD